MTIILSIFIREYSLFLYKLLGSARVDNQVNILLFESVWGIEPDPYLSDLNLISLLVLNFYVNSLLLNIKIISH